MLYEVICERFKEKRIEFHNGLNTVLGDNIGNNSIGKSTFLMIIDFVYGGKDYMISSTDIQRNIGEHIIKFCFIFDDVQYYFSRNTSDLEIVNKCDEKYNIIESMSLDKYCEFLKKKYKITINNVSFRNLVGRFSRIYGKENLDEKHPLHIVRNEKSGDPTNVLLKIFGLYDVIADLERALKEAEEHFKAYKEAQKYDYILSINKKKYIANQEELESLNNEKDKICENLEYNLSELDSIKTDEVLSLKKMLSTIKRNKSKLKNELEGIEDKLAEKTTLSKHKYEELLHFFPNCSVKHIEEIENFHRDIVKVLKFEFKKKKKELLKLIIIADENIHELEIKIKNIAECPKLSYAILTAYSNTQKRIETLERENSSFETANELTKSKNTARQQRNQIKIEQLAQLQTILNNKMLEINDYIYAKKKKPPIITFSDNQYTFQTINDTGTGTSYKSMIVYDLSILELTQLPILIHDSVVLKQISDTALEKILLKYRSSGKQIFIALDKISSYSLNSQKILKDTKVLELSSQGNELFGESWNDKHVTEEN